MPGLLATKDPTFDDRGQRIPHTNASHRPRLVDVPRHEVLDSLARGRADIGAFALDWLGIEGNRGQIEWCAACAERDEGGYRPRYLTTVVSAGNRAGKTLGMAVVALHHTFYKLGLRPPVPGDPIDAQRWMSAPYDWYHVAIRQDIAHLAAMSGLVRRDFVDDRIGWSVHLKHTCDRASDCGGAAAR